MSALIESIDALLVEGESEDLARRLRKKYDIELWMTEPRWGDDYEPHIVGIDSIVVPEDRRGTGTGSKAMQELVDWADRKTYILALNPSADFGGTVSRLRKFYGRFGFVKNLGRKKDYRTRKVMIRYPEGYSP